MASQISYRFYLGDKGLNYTHLERDMLHGDMASGSSNFNLKDGECFSRGGTQHRFFYASASISAIYQFVKKKKSYCISITKSGELRADNLVLKTGLIFTTNPFFVQWNGNLIIFTDRSAPQVWDGESINSYDIPADDMPIDWTFNGTYPNKVIVRGSGNSERAWACGVDGNKKVLYYSVLNDGISSYPDFSEKKTSGFMYIETQDESGITALTDFGDKLILFSSRESFIVIDTSSELSEWGYISTQMSGGCASQALLVKTQNDIIVMMYDGYIYSVSAVQEYGDYKMASISDRIRDYIQEHINLGYIEKFHCIFDPVIRAVKFFAVKKSSQEVSCALVFFIDKGKDNGWMIHDNLNYTSGYNAICSSVFKFYDTSITFQKSMSKVYTGSIDGHIWELETPEISDNKQHIPMIISTPALCMDDHRHTKRFKRAYLDVACSSTMASRIKFYIGDELQKEIKFYFTRDTNDRWDYNDWDSFIWSEFIRGYEIAKYNINLIGVDLKQVIEFNIDRDEFYTYWDSFNWDYNNWDTDNTDQNYTFSKSMFSVSTNMIDYSPLATRTNLTLTQ